MILVLIVGLLMNAVALPLAGKRIWFLWRVISSGQPAPDRIEGVTGRLGAATKRQVVEVLGQKKMLKWSVPGTAHFFVMWAFFILATVYLEAYGSLLKLLFTGGDGPMDWAIPLVGHWAVLGFLQDFIAVMALFGLVTFYVIRLRNAPKDLGRKSRFFGSHLGPAYLTLFMIFNVIWTMFLFRGASSALGNLPYTNGAFASIGVGKLLDGLSHSALEVIEGIGLLLHIGVMLIFLIFVLNSKHLHIFLAPLNVLFGRYPVALGAAKPMMSDGKALTLDDLEDLDEDAKLGVGAAEDFSWKGILDMATCTECGRCQDQCPAWNTEKPLSPKLMIMALRDHTMAKAPYLLADEGKRDGLLEGNEKLAREVERPLVGDTGDDWFYMPDSGAAVIDPDVLWSCVTCGACVQQCPVDIEHVDHIVDMRRYQVLVESNFPAELNGLFKGLENKGNPWNMSPTVRMDWAKDLPFDVKLVGKDIESLDEVDWLFWVGCAGAYEDRAKKTTRAVAELLDMAGVSFGVLGNGETCTGDSARRAGNEFVFQGLAAQNVETFKEYKVKKAVTTCAHCFNTLKNEYKELGIELEVVHHTQLLNQLVREKKLTPVAASNPGPKRSITYHDPCYIGRHNQVYSPPRELLAVIPDAELTEMPRNSERSFCCGAGGARMWMEETIGSRINETRTAEAVATGADQIAVGCPFCRVMLSDGLTNAQSKGEAREEVEVLDVAQMLLASIKGESKAPKKAAAAKAGSSSSSDAGSGTSTATVERPENDQDEATEAEPDAGDVTQTDETVTETEDVGPAAKASGGSSLFDLGDSSETGAEPEPEPEKGPDAKSSGGSLFDLGDSSETEAEPEPEEGAEPDAKASDSSDDGFAGGSLFDVGDSTEPEAGPEAKSEPEAKVVEKAEEKAEPDKKSKPASSGTISTPGTEIPEGGSLFDIEAPAEEAAHAASDDTTPADHDAAA
ncbi:MAG: heterodisulfide reductase-related iron-sulfur binding cluster, partial [Marmoricola sp.]